MTHPMTHPTRLLPLPLLFALGCGGAPATQPTHATPEATPASQPMTHAHHPDHHHHHGFDDPQTFASRWDSPERDTWQKPDAVIARLALPPTATLADIGAGTGYFAVRLARAIPQGTVYAADLEPAMIAHLTTRAQTEALPNLIPVQASPEDPQLPAPVDLVMLTNTYHHIQDRPAYFTRLRASLKPAARVAILDYKLVTEGHGPPPAMRLAPDTVIEEMTQAGYTLTERDEDTLPRQYLLIFDAAKE